MTAVSDIVLPALSAVGIRFYGSPAGADETDTAISELNAMLASWAGTWCNFLPYNAVAPFSGDGSTLTMGTDPVGPTVGDFPARAASIRAVYLQQGDPATGGLSYEIPLGPVTAFHEIRYPSTAALPREAFLQKGFPLDTLKLFPRLQSGYSIRVVGNSYFPKYGTIADIVQMPDEYVEACWMNLALRLGLLFRVQIDTDLEKRANSALKNVKIDNAASQIRGMPNDMAGGSNAGWNYLSGWGF